MKKLLLFSAAFVMGFAAMSQQKVDEVIKLDNVRYDFGKIKQGVPVTTYFTITNLSDVPVIIESATAGCGCTTPEFSKEPIAPNSTTKLKVGYNAGAMGHFEKPVTIKLAGVTETKVINITGEVVPADAVVEDAITKTKGTTVTPVVAKPATKTTKAVKKTDKKTVKKTVTSTSK